MSKHKKFNKQICIRLDDKYYNAMLKILDRECKLQSEYIREVLVRNIKQDAVALI